MSRNDYRGITIGMVVLGLFLATLVILPTRTISLIVLGSELTLVIDTTLQFGIVLTALVCVSSDLLVRSHPNLPDRSFGYSVTFWVLPAITTLSAFILLPLISGWAVRIVLTAATGLLLYIIQALQFRSISRDENSWGARLGLQIAVYLAMLLFYVVISSSAMRAIISASSVLVVSALLSLELVRELESHSGRIWFYALLIGLLMGEFKWIINYIKLDARLGGALLLILFYCLTGFARSLLQKRLTVRVGLEYGIISLAGIVSLVMLNKWL